MTTSLNAVTVNGQIQTVTIPTNTLIAYGQDFVNPSDATSIETTPVQTSVPSTLAPIISVSESNVMNITTNTTTSAFIGTVIEATDPTNGVCDCGIDSDCGTNLSYIEVVNG